ncbi:EcsC family protein [Algoriphagus namhaensis]
MEAYRHYLQAELNIWLFQMKKPPGIMNRMTRGVQKRINDLLPEKLHQAVTLAIENMVKAVMTGSKWVLPKKDPSLSLKTREMKVRQRIKWYRNTASAEGALTGAGGILLGLADFPAFLTIKMKMLFDIGSLYGADMKDKKERLFLLYIFQLTFSSQQRKNELIQIIEKWESFDPGIPENLEGFDWRTFQLDYRDYIDLAKLAQLVPLVGAPVGALANYKLTEQLGNNAMNCFRLRLIQQKNLPG